MKLKDVLKFVPDVQRMRIILGDEELEGEASAIDRYLHDELLNTAIDEMTADGNVLKVWLE